MGKATGAVGRSRTRTAVSAAESASYVFCLVDSPMPPSTDGAPPGLEGFGPLRTVDAGGGLWLVAADAPLSRYGSDAIAAGLEDLDWVGACALAHEEMVSRFAAAYTVIPLKLFTLFHSDERALAHFQASRSGLDAVFNRLRGREEWGVRVRFDEQLAREAAARKLASGPKTSSGTAFLLMKKRQQDTIKAVASEARSAAEQAFEALSRVSVESRKRPPAASGGGVRLLLDAVFLIERAEVEAFQREVEQVSRMLAEAGCDCVPTGPWPAYNFVAEPE